MTDLGIGAEVPHEGQMHHGVGPLGAEHVFELPLAEVDDVQADVVGRALPRDAVDARDLEEVRHPPGDEPALAARNPGDEELLARLGAAVGTSVGGRRGVRLREVEELLGSLEGGTGHGCAILVRRRAGQQPMGGLR